MTIAFVNPSCIAKYPVIQFHSVTNFLKSHQVGLKQQRHHSHAIPFAQNVRGLKSLQVYEIRRFKLSTLRMLLHSIKHSVTLSLQEIIDKIQEASTFDPTQE